MDRIYTIKLKPSKIDFHSVIVHPAVVCPLFNAKNFVLIYCRYDEAKKNFKLSGIELLATTLIGECEN